jgi:hypothetical protein
MVALLLLGLGACMLGVIVALTATGRSISIRAIAIAGAGGEVVPLRAAATLTE